MFSTKYVTNCESMSFCRNLSSYKTNFLLEQTIIQNLTIAESTNPYPHFDFLLSSPSGAEGGCSLRLATLALMAARAAASCACEEGAIPAGRDADGTILIGSEILKVFTVWLVTMGAGGAGVRLLLKLSSNSSWEGVIVKRITTSHRWYEGISNVIFFYRCQFKWIKYFFWIV